MGKKNKTPKPAPEKLLPNYQYPIETFDELRKRLSIKNKGNEKEKDK